MARVGADTYPGGSGFAFGFALGAIVGSVGWLVTRTLPIALLLFVATGTPLGVLIEQSLPTRPATPRERRVVIVLLALAMLAAFIVLFAVLVG